MNELKQNAKPEPINVSEDILRVDDLKMYFPVTKGLLKRTVSAGAAPVMPSDHWMAMAAMVAPSMERGTTLYALFTSIVPRYAWMPSMLTSLAAASTVLTLTLFS